MYILGISCFYHDSAAALIKDGNLITTVQEERFSRKKNDGGFPSSAIEFCLKTAGITSKELDYAVFYEKPMRKFDRLLRTIINFYPKTLNLFCKSMISMMKEKLWIKYVINEKLEIPLDKILFTDHHESHASASFYCSPFEDSAILTIDGVGEWTTAAYGIGHSFWKNNSKDKNSIKLFKELRFPISLGLLYSVITAYLGFEVNEGEYKVMGMAPYGKPLYADKIKKMLKIKEDGSFTIDESYLKYHYHTTESYSEKFTGLFGSPRNRKDRFVTGQTSLYDDVNPATETEMEKNQYYADVASSIQSVTEEILLKMAKHIFKETGKKNLCISGGVGLNSVANFKILRQAGFENVYIQPAAGDAGGAIGAALFVYHSILNEPRKFIMEHCYWGQKYSDNEIETFLKSNNIKYEKISGDENLFDRVTDLLINGNVIGWFQNEFEWGPRALGNRSILGDPRREDMKDIINIKIKFREPFRPFAPSVLEDRAEDFFEFDGVDKQYPPRFMLMVCPVKKEKQNVLPAITHIDGSGRLQTVIKKYNPRYYRLIERFGEKTGVPVIINTSFNLKGEPIVNTPANAYSTFSASGMDALVLQNYLILK
ncbi:MAG TPA: carbamoyltransferase N-terminal domain-containing protein [bacterium]|nr:carbamoyltransferase N-terminal domain-containing protein [bacterium]HPN31067.1 carbamoyltransferase N-terminal domain-containing protein [bacterium]